MLTRLYIRNYALISQMDVNFHPGFSVITGETGAGKSIILGAMGLLLGGRADTKSVKPGSDRCVIEGHFDVSRYSLTSFFDANNLDYDDTDCILRRELTAAGKSRAFINDTPVTLAVMRELGEQLIDIHSQHQNLLLKKEDFQLSVVDIIAQDKPLLEQYAAAWHDYRTRKHQLETLREEIRKSQENEDFIRYQHHELDEARLQAGEQEALEQESELLTHAEEIKSVLYEADSQLSSDGGIIEMLRNVSHSMDDIQHLLPSMQETAERLDACYVELKDIGRDINLEADRLEVDPQRLAEVDARLDTLYHLQQKFHVGTVDELIQLRDEYARQIEQITRNDDLLIEADAAAEAALGRCRKLSDELHKIRLQSARKIEQEMVTRLVPLGIAHVRFKVHISAKPMCGDGCDKVEFHFSANKNMPLQPLTQVASGGETARVMLTLKALISNAVQLPTIVFDEIDTGVSGKTAEMMAHIMEEMGHGGRQVISITHLPQIASLGQSHYRVYKSDSEEGTESHMTELDEEGRVQEIAQMLSGSDVSAAARENAMALMYKDKNNDKE